MPPIKTKTKTTIRNAFDVHRKEWNDICIKLVTDKDKHGHCEVPPNDKIDDSNGDNKSSLSTSCSLGPSIKSQRKDDKNKNQSSKDRIETKSMSLVLCTKKSHEDNWNNMFDRLVSYKQKHGNCLVPDNFEEDTQVGPPLPVGKWVMNQRTLYKNNILPNGRVSKLKQIGFEFCVRTKKENDDCSSIASLDRRQLLVQKQQRNNIGESSMSNTDKRVKKTQDLEDNQSVCTLEQPAKHSVPATSTSNIDAYVSDSDSVFADAEEEQDFVVSMGGSTLWSSPASSNSRSRPKTTATKAADSIFADAEKDKIVAVEPSSAIQSALGTRLVSLEIALDFSQESHQQIDDRDRLMGLKKCHSITMRSTRRSRVKVRELVKRQIGALSGGMSKATQAGCMEEKQDLSISIF